MLTEEEDDVFVEAGEHPALATPSKPVQANTPGAFTFDHSKVVLLDSISHYHSLPCLMSYLMFYVFTLQLLLTVRTVVFKL
jgi:hypothetical protein